jgi:hypothetical protein
MINLSAFSPWAHFVPTRQFCRIRSEAGHKASLRGFVSSRFQRRLLTLVTKTVTSSPISFTEGPFARVLSKVERGRSPRAALRPAPGRLRASVTPVLRPVREVQSLDWDR